MVISSFKWLEPELMDVVRLFPGAESLELRHSFEESGAAFVNTVTCGAGPEARERRYTDLPEAHEFSLRREALVKRYAKLALYRFLSSYYRKELPWGSLTGIRPTRLAYQELEQGRPFGPLFEKLMVSEENARLVARVLKGQEGIYEKREGNADLYVSLPFCPTKCDYCSFITAPIGKTRQFVPAYLDALEKEARAARPLIRDLRSVYVGGGTPFVLEVEELERVLAALAPLRTNGCEYTVEAGRPDVFTPAKLDLCAKYGVTRVCINAQSFSDRTLEAIGRKHTRADLYRAFEMTKPYPFAVNCDLIAGLTGESLAEFCASVDEAISLSPENITVHTLCLKSGAKLKEERLSRAPRAEKPHALPLKEDDLAEMISYSRQALTAAGYEPYYLYRQKYMAGAHENVGWTKAGYASVYNIDTMEELSDNLALGSNAISKKLYLKEGRIERLASPKDIPTYLEKVDKVIEEKQKLFG